MRPIAWIALAGLFLGFLLVAATVQAQSAVPPLRDIDSDLRQRYDEAFRKARCARADHFCDPMFREAHPSNDRLARYLIARFEGHVAAGDLTLIAYADSEIGFEFLRQRVDDAGAYDLAARRAALIALSKTANPKAFDVAIEILDTESDPVLLKAAMNTFWRVPIATGVLPPEILDLLRRMERGEIYDGRFRHIAGKSLQMLDQRFEIQRPDLP